MTTIVYRDGVMAADTRGYSGKQHPLGLRLKVRRLNDGCLVGVGSREVGQADCVADWLTCGGSPAELEKALGTFERQTFQALKVNPDGSASLYDDTGWPSLAEGPYYAVGSGEDFAYGALASGRCAVEAVAVAIQLDPWSDYPLLYLRHTDVPAEFLPDLVAVTKYLEQSR